MNYRKPLEATETLPPIDVPIPQSIRDVIESEGSFAGYHSVATFMACPERSRLRSAGVRKKKLLGDVEGPQPLDNLQYGNLIHTLLAVRAQYGQDVAEVLLGKNHALPHWVLEPVKPLELTIDDRDAALVLLREYDSNFPRDKEPFRVIGIEVPILTNVGDGRGGSCFRSARYDQVIQVDDPNRGAIVFSLEHKTAKSGGSMVAYTPQAMVQVALWNRNPNLVQRYGPMAGVVFDVLIKTKVPKVLRHPPKYVSEAQIEKAVEYLRLPNDVKYPVAADGSHPRMLHECWGKYQPCDYVEWCIEGAAGLYEIKPKG